VRRALLDARRELDTMFDETIGMTGVVELAELDGPQAVIRLRGRFWHKRADVLARHAAYLHTRVPELSDVVIEHPRQLSDGPEMFDPDTF